MKGDKMLQIAIDGPAGSGKSTVSKLIANKMGINYLDTGAMYRMCTLKALNENVDLSDEKAIIDVVKDIDIEIKNNVFFLDGKDVSKDIRKQIVSNNVSKVAAIEFVRKKMVEIQRNIASKSSVIMDGRDIGSHVLINSKNKYYLNASIEERGRRRYQELVEKGNSVDRKVIEKEIALRDKLDMEREISPLIKAEDAVEIDTTNLSINQVVELIIKKVSDKND